jgi:hypothetical protein
MVTVNNDFEHAMILKELNPELPSPRFNHDQLFKNTHGDSEFGEAHRYG